MRFRDSTAALSRWPRLLAGGVWVAALSLAAGPAAAQTDSLGNPTPTNPGSSVSSSLSSSTSSSGSSRRSSSSPTSYQDIVKRAQSKAASSASRSLGARGALPPIPDAARKTNVVKRTAPRAGAPGGSEAAPLPEITMPDGIKSNALYLDPPQNSVVVGDRFATGVFLYDVENAPVDAIDLWLKYDPSAIEPVSVDAAPIAKSTAEPLAPEVWRDEGRIHLKASLTSPITKNIAPIVRIQWHAVGKAAASHIEFAAPAGQTVAAWAGKRNLIVPTNVGDRSRLGAVIRVSDPGAGDSALQMVDLPESIAPSADPRSRVRLAIVARDSSVAAGAVSAADVVLLNPENLPFDHISFRIRYNPADLKILDADQNNYISNGINIFDGDFHSAFPFDYQGANRVDPALGLIDYSMGTLGGAQHYASGVVARIVFRMERSSGETAFWFERADPFRGGVQTEIADGGASLLGPTDAAAAKVLHGVWLNAVSPAPMTAKP